MLSINGKGYFVYFIYLFLVELGFELFNCMKFLS
jgi:hypothetical protein